MKPIVKDCWTNGKYSGIYGTIKFLVGGIYYIVIAYDKLSIIAKLFIMIYFKYIGVNAKKIKFINIHLFFRPWIKKIIIFPIVWWSKTMFRMHKIPE